MPAGATSLQSLFTSAAAQGAQPYQTFLQQQAAAGQPDLTQLHLHVYYSSYIQALSAINFQLNCQLAAANQSGSARPKEE